MMYKDLQAGDFIFRFIKENNEWVCKLPDWLMEVAEKEMGRKNEIQQPRGNADSSPLSN